MSGFIKLLFPLLLLLLTQPVLVLPPLSGVFDGPALSAALVGIDLEVEATGAAAVDGADDVDLSTISVIFLFGANDLYGCDKVEAGPDCRWRMAPERSEEG